MTLANELIEKGKIESADVEVHQRTWHTEYASPDSRPTLVQHIIERKNDTNSDAEKKRELAEFVEQLEESRRGDLGDEILKDALDSLSDNSAVLFVGAGFSMSPDTVRKAGGWQLCQHLASVLKKKVLQGIPDNEIDKLTLPQVSLRLEREMGRKALNKILLRWCKENLPRDPMNHHQTLAKLSPCSHIVTTNWDHLIESAYGSGNISVIRNGPDLPYARPGLPKLIKLHGDIASDYRRWSPDPVCTDEDIFRLKDTDRALYNYMQSLFLTHKIIIIGLHPSDFNLYQFMNFAFRHLGKEAPKPIVVDPDPHVVKGVPGPLPEHIPMKASSFLETVERWQRLCNGSVGVVHKQMNKHAPCSRVWSDTQVARAEAVMNRYPQLRRVEVVKTVEGDGGSEEVKRMVGARGARILEEWSQTKKKVVVSCGSTLASMVDQVDPNAEGMESLEIRSSSILMADYVHETSPPNLVTRFARRIESRGSYGIAHQVPSVMGYSLAPEELRSYMKMPQRYAASPLPSLDEASLSVVRKGIRFYLEESGSSDMFFLGVGSVPSAYKALDRFALYCLRSCGYWDENRDSIEVAEGKIRNYFSILHSERHYIGDLMYKLVRRPSLGDSSLRSLFASLDDVKNCLLDKPEKTDLFMEFFARLTTHCESVSPDRIVKATKDESKLVCFLCAGRDKAVPLKILLESGMGNNVVIDEALAMELLRL